MEFLILLQELNLNIHPYKDVSSFRVKPIEIIISSIKIDNLSVRFNTSTKRYNIALNERHRLVIISCEEKDYYVEIRSENIDKFYKIKDIFLNKTFIISVKDALRINKKVVLYARYENNNDSIDNNLYSALEIPVYLKYVTAVEKYSKLSDHGGSDNYYTYIIHVKTNNEIKRTYIDIKYENKKLEELITFILETLKLITLDSY